MMRARTGILAAILAVAPVAGLSAAGFSIASLFDFEAPESVRPTWGVLMEPLLDPEASSAIANPSINFNLGAGVVLPLASSPRWAVEPSADIYWYYCAYMNDRAVPAEETLGDAFVLGLLVEAPFIYSFPISGRFSAGVGGGLCLDLRVAFDVSSSGNIGSINGYLWDKARFILPSTLARVEYRLSDRVECGVQLRGLLPIFNLWTPDAPGFFDQAIFLVDMAIRYRLR